MNIFTKIGQVIQSLFGAIANTAAETAKVIQRKRVFTPETLAETFVLGHAKNPDPTMEDLAQTAAECGAPVSAQAVDKRFNTKTEQFL